MQERTKAKRITALSIVLALLLAGLAWALWGSFGNEAESETPISLSWDSEGYDLDRLHAHKTPYIGDNSNVAAIAQLLPSPDATMKYDRIALQTDTEPFGLTIYYVPATEITEYPMDEHANPASDYNKRKDKNFVLLFSLIDNLGQVSLNTDYTSIDNGNGVITVPRSNYEQWLSEDLWADEYKKLIELFGILDNKTAE